MARMMPLARRRRQRIALGIFLLAMAGASTAQTTTLAGKHLAEASGLIASRAFPGEFWALNDSGNKARLMRFEPNTATVRPFDIANVKNVDWEDLALMTWGQQTLLLIADTGDNRERRGQVQLHFLPELTPADRSPAVQHSVWVHYPDGPHDCEAVAFDPIHRQILLVTKRDLPPRLYVIDAADALRQETVTAQFAGTLPELPKPHLNPERPYVRWSFQPTAMDIRASDGAILLLNYVEAYLFHRQANETVVQALQRTPDRLGMPDLPQAEGIAFTLDGQAAAIISEDLPTQFVTLPLPWNPQTP